VSLLEPTPDETEFRVYWLMLAAKAGFQPEKASDLDLTIEVRSGDVDAAHYRIHGGDLALFHGPAIEPDLVVGGSPTDLAKLFRGQLGARAASSNGIELQGDAETLQRLLASFRLPAEAPLNQRG
jgi:putative sterol carrier protein